MTLLEAVYFIPAGDFVFLVLSIGRIGGRARALVQIAFTAPQLVLGLLLAIVSRGTSLPALLIALAAAVLCVAGVRALGSEEARKRDHP